MIICICKRISELQIRQLVTDGCDLQEIKAKTGAGTDCKACIKSIQKVINNIPSNQ